MKPNIIRKHLPELTKEEFLTNMKALMRWSKDNGYYMFLRNYLDDYDKIYEAVTKPGSGYSISNFSEALGLIGFISIKYKQYGHQYWADNVKDLYYAWKKYYYDSLPESKIEGENNSA